eukprot:jgi/Chlat1/934/Chrsp108S01367
MSAAAVTPGAPSAMGLEGQTALARCKPLCVPQPIFLETDHRVQLMLDEPLKEEPDMRVLIALSCYVNMLVERYEWLSSSGVEMQGQPVPDHLRRQVETSCRLLSYDRAEQEVLESTQMFTVFPEFAKYILGDPLTQAPAVSQPGLDYLAYVTLLNQLVMMSTQLHEDAKLQNHKYIAHQIALLYQCLNLTRAETNAFKKRVEEQFESIKQITEQAAATPELSDFHRQWLQKVTWDIREAVSQFPPQLLQRLQPMADVVRHAQASLAS